MRVLYLAAINAWMKAMGVFCLVVTPHGFIA
jgi:hypothetical protein